MGYVKKLLALLFVVCLCGCGVMGEQTGEKIGIQETGLQEMEGTTESEKESEGSSEAETVKLLVNTEKANVETYWDGIHMAKPFASVGDTLYFCQWAGEDREAALYEMKIGGEILQKMDIELPSDMKVYGLAGKGEFLYLLLRTQLTQSEISSIIRKVDREGNVIQEWDVSEALGSKVALHQIFLVDGKENFYVRGLNSAVLIDNNGTRLWENTDESMGICNSYAAAVGKDNAIYMTYQRENSTYIGKINSTDGTLAEEWELPEIQAEDRILAMGQGTDSDFLLYNNRQGSFAWNQETEKLEKRSDVSETEASYQEIVVIRAFLSDGRLLLVKNIASGDVPTGRVYQYLPAGK